MPKNKRPNRKPRVKKLGKQAADGGNIAGAPGNKVVAKTYGPPNASRSQFNPAMSRRSARNR